MDKLYKFYKNKPTHDIAIGYNTKVTIYANGDKNITHHSYSNFKGIVRSRGVGKVSDEERERLELKNHLEVRRKIVDLIYHNGLIKPWEYFITLTFDDNKVNGKDYEQVREVMRKWIDNQKHQNPYFEYVIVPEYHKSGRIHFHGVVRGVTNWQLSPARYPSGRLIYKNGIQIFNLDNYKFGFTTISEIQNKEAVAVYTSKYITKEFIKIENAKKYWRSKSLEFPRIEYAELTPDELDIFIDDSKYELDLKNTENSTSIYVKCRSSYNV